MTSNLTIRNAQIIFRNFSGKASQYTPEGRRTFSVLIEDGNLSETLHNDGWNVKSLRKRDENDEQHWHLPIAVFFGNYPPQIVMVSGESKTNLDESTVNMLDWADIKYVNVTIRPREYEVGGRKGIKAYLKTLVVYVEEDELLSELSDMDNPYADEEGDVPF